MYTSKQFTWTNEPFTLLGVTVSNERDIGAMNYAPVVDKMHTVLESWKDRTLSLTSKVQVINTLCESLFVYKLCVLPSISSTLIKRIDGLIDHFLWNGKRARISKETLRVSKSNGGLQLFDIQRKEVSLKINWICKLQDSSFLQSCFFDATKFPRWPQIASCNLTTMDACNFCSTKEFWGDCFKAWCSINYHNPQNIDQILDEVLWLNSCI